MISAVNAAWDAHARVRSGHRHPPAAYVWGLGLAYAVDTGGAIAVYHADGLGSVRALTDSSGAHVLAALPPPTPPAA